MCKIKKKIPLQVEKGSRKRQSEVKLAVQKFLLNLRGNEKIFIEIKSLAVQIVF